MRYGRAGTVLALLSFGAVSAAHAASELRIAATVAPVHSLVAMVTGDLSEPAMIVRPGASPHDYALKPSEAKALDEADVVFWVGEGLEPWMAKAVTTLAGDAVTVELGEIDGIERLPFRESGVWSDHDGEDEDHHDDHDHDHGHGEGIDPHLWLDPDNAVIWLSAIADALSDADPEYADRYRRNADAAAREIEAMTVDIEALLRPIEDKPYTVFHDAYQYFERRFGLRPLGAVSLSDADRPGPAHLQAVKQAIAERGAVCIFSEPQFEPRLIETVTEGSDVKSGVLDPIGSGQRPGAGLYPNLMRALAESLRDCLG